MNFSSFAGRRRRSRHLLSHSDWGEAREESIFGLGAPAPPLACCPIDLEKIRQMDSIPDHTADHGEEPSEAFAEEGLEAEQDVQQQGSPYLPAYRIGGVAEEVAVGRFALSA